MQNEKEKFKKYRSVIINEFYPEADRFDPSLRFSVAKKAISDFRKPQSCSGSQHDFYGSPPQDCGKSWLCLPIARKTLCGRQWLRQTQSLGSELKELLQ